MSIRGGNIEPVLRENEEKVREGRKNQKRKRELETYVRLDEG